MGRIQEKKRIREQIIRGAKAYAGNLAGRVFLFESDTYSFELYFPIRTFLHLTGVATTLPARQFYKNALKDHLRLDQFGFSKQHPFDLAKEKASRLELLPELTRNLVCIVNGYKTLTFTYVIGVTNLDFTLGLSENIDIGGNLINNWLIPRTLRVGDDAISNSADCELVRRISVRSADGSNNRMILYEDDE